LHVHTNAAYTPLCFVCPPTEQTGYSFGYGFVVLMMVVVLVLLVPLVVVVDLQSSTNGQKGQAGNLQEWVI